MSGANPNKLKSFRAHPKSVDASPGTHVRQAFVLLACASGVTIAAALFVVPTSVRSYPAAIKHAANTLDQNLVRGGMTVVSRLDSASDTGSVKPDADNDVRLPLYQQRLRAEIALKETFTPEPAATFQDMTGGDHAALDGAADHERRTFATRRQAVLDELANIDARQSTLEVQRHSLEQRLSARIGERELTARAHSSVRNGTALFETTPATLIAQQADGIQTRIDQIRSDIAETDAVLSELDNLREQVRRSYVDRAKRELAASQSIEARRDSVHTATIAKPSSATNAAPSSRLVAVAAIELPTARALKINQPVEVGFVLAGANTRRRVTGKVLHISEQHGGSPAINKASIVVALPADVAIEKMSEAEVHLSVPGRNAIRRLLSPLLGG